MLKEQLIALLQKEQQPEWIAFLHSLDKSGKKELVPVIKAMLRDNNEFVQIGVNTYAMKGKASHSEMLQVAAFVCMSRVDYEKTPYTTWLFTKENLDPILDWYCPDWFSDFVNSQASARELPYNFSYELIMEFTEKGWLHPTPQLLAKALHARVYDRQRRETYYRPDALLQRPVTLKEHIWCLFQYETNIHLFERYIHGAHGIEPNQSGWLLAFRRFIDAGQIDRSRLLKEALLASNNNFNKLASGWFAELFAGLNPTQEEIIILQPSLFGVLHSPHSKPVNTALDCLKKIASHKDFDVAGFMEQSPALLSSDTKNLVGAVLALLEKLAKSHSSLRPSIAVLATQVFIHPDESLQTRAAKLILDLQKDIDGSLPEKLAPYRDSMKLMAKSLLQSMLDTSASKPPGKALVPVLPPAEEAIALPVIGSLDDLIFLASQAFDNNQSWHIDTLPAALLQWQPHLADEPANWLEAALQRALQTTASYSLQSRQGYFSHLLACFFIDICLYLVNAHPKQTGPLQQVITRFEIKEKKRLGSGFVFDSANFLASWHTDHSDALYQPYKALLLQALKQFRTAGRLPLLSTPTHEPAWIDPVTLVLRLSAWQQQQQEPETLDLQLALTRCRLMHTQDAIAKAEELLTGEWLHLLLFLLGEHPEPQGPFHHAEAWITASLALPEKKKYPALEHLGYYRAPFNYYSGRYEWYHSEERFLTSMVNETTGKKEEGYGSRYMILPKVAPVKRGGHDTKGKLLHDYISFPGEQLHLLPVDLRRFLLMAPNNPGPILVRLLMQHLRYSDFFEATDREFIANAMQVMYEIWGPTGYTAHVFLATCMLTGDKTVRNIAGETWLKGAARGHINQQQAGRALGLQLGGNYAPLKRFTDLVEQQLLSVSDLHNQQLQLLVENLLAASPDVPVKHLKKLLELYTELLAVNHAKLDNEAVQSKLLLWRDTAGLKKIIERCIQLS